MRRRRKKRGDVRNIMMHGPTGNDSRRLQEAKGEGKTVENERKRASERERGKKRGRKKERKKDIYNNRRDETKELEIYSDASIYKQSRLYGNICCTITLCERETQVKER